MVNDLAEVDGGYGHVLSRSELVTVLKPIHHTVVDYSYGSSITTRIVIIMTL